LSIHRSRQKVLRQQSRSRTLLHSHYLRLRVERCSLFRARTNGNPPARSHSRGVSGGVDRRDSCSYLLHRRPMRLRQRVDRIRSLSRLSTAVRSSQPAGRCGL